MVPSSQFEKEGVLGRAPVIPKRSGTTWGAATTDQPLKVPKLTMLRKKGVPGRALVIPKRNGTTSGALIFGPPVRTQTFHRGTPNTHILPTK